MKKIIIILLLISNLSLLNAQSISSSVVVNSATAVSSSSFQIRSTLGQANIGRSSSSSFNLRSGFWYGVSEKPELILITQDLKRSLDVNGTVNIDANDFYISNKNNIEISTLSISKDQFDCNDFGNNTLLLTVVDKYGQSESSIVNLEVTNNFVLDDLSDIDINLIDESAQFTEELISSPTFNCGELEVIPFSYNLDCSDIGLNEFTISFTDNYGNTFTTQQSVNVIETEVPKIKSKGSITIYLDENASATLSISDIEKGSKDNCGIDSQVLSNTYFDCTNLGSNTISYTITDLSGNTSSKSIKVNVKDTINPIINAIPLITKYLDQNGSATINPNEFDNGSFDNCDISRFTLSKTKFGKKDINDTLDLTFKAIDFSKNKSEVFVKVVVLDTIKPTIITHRNIELDLNNDGFVSLSINKVDSASFDNVKILSKELSSSSFDCGDLGSNQIEYKVTDESGNESIEIVEVQINDKRAPKLSTNNLTIYLNENSEANITAGDVNNGSNDNCGITQMFISRSDFTCSDLGSNSITFTAVDGSGNSSSKTVKINVKDTLSPTLIAFDSLTRYLDETGSLSIANDEFDNGSNDNCSISEFKISKSSFNRNNLGTNELSFTVIDNSKNKSELKVELVIKDTIRPTILAYSYIEFELDKNGSAELKERDVDSASYDNTKIESISLSNSNFSCDDIGQNNIDLIIEDISGNIASQTVEVNVFDRIKPSLKTKNLTIQLDSNASATISLDDVDNGSSDNCSIVSSSISKSEFDGDDLGYNFITFEAKDGSNNTASKTVRINVQDKIKPWFKTFPENISKIVPKDTSAKSFRVYWDDPIAYDNVEIASVESNYSPGDFFKLGNTKVNYTAIDNSGNKTKRSFTVQVKKDNSKIIFESNELDNIALNLYPNPVSDEMTISYKLDQTNNVKISIIDMTGSIVKQVFDGSKDAGNYDLNINTFDQYSNRIPAGTYFLVIYVDDKIQSIPFVIIR